MNETSGTSVVTGENFDEDRLASALEELSPSRAPRARALWPQIRNKLSARFFRNVPPAQLAAYLAHLADQWGAHTPGEPPLIDLRKPRDPETPWNREHTLLTLVADPLPFAIDSLYELLHQQSIRIDHSFHHRVEALPPAGDEPGDEPAPERLVAGLALEPLSGDEFETLREDLVTTYEELTLAVEDFDPMLERARRMVKRLEEYARGFPEQTARIEQNRRFLQYMIDDNFVFLGYRESRFEPRREGNGFADARGIMRHRELEEPLFSSVPITERDTLETGSGSLLTIARTNLDSRIYRREKLDYVGLKNLDENGRLVGEDGFVGLFTDRVLAEPAVRIPLLDHKFEEILRREDVQEHTHAYRELYATYNSMPKHLLFMTPTEELAADLRNIMATHEETVFRLLVRQHPYHVGLTLIVLMPRHRFSGEVRRTIERELERELEPRSMEGRLSLGEGEIARLYFDLQTDRDRPRSGSFRELEERLDRLTRSWRDRFDDAVHRRVETPERAETLIHRYEPCLPGEYRALVDPEQAVQDVRHLDSLPGRRQDVLAGLRNPSAGEFTHLVLYSEKRLALNDTLPLLTHHGLQVHEHYTFPIPVDDPPVHLHLIPVQGPDARPLDLSDGGEKLLRSIEGALAGRLRDDTLNRLILQEGMSPRSLNLFRLYRSYYHQLDPGLKLESIHRALIDQPQVARRLFKLFRAKFDPAPDEAQRRRKLDRTRGLVEDQIEQIEQRTPYQVLRTLANLIEATVRTNYFQPARPDRWIHEDLAEYDRAQNKHYISVKIDPARVEEMPSPRPRHEIFVHSPYMEAVHLRGGRIARGGIRWSDRRDDYRHEVLNLMKTQQVKNAVIVPDGAKGGFVIKEEHLDMDRPREQARRQYEVFMHGLLDLTDNRGDDGETIPPADTVCYDDPDPYLVVAADKGTATFSDLANAVAESHDFWMGDAYATGGSEGYDHKELGITARGAWVCVQRHFRDAGRDPGTEPLSVVGIGDMSGDVFGNGLLLSEQFRLLGAFDHRHVFLDPDPDPEASREERRRLFERPDSTWADYDESVLSPGGGVYDRNAGLIDPSPRAREVLELGEGKLEPSAVVRAVLTADVDLLWNGGIGTYVKATHQTHAEVGDPQNDAFRVDASQVRADVIAEGGNLGITPAGRVELDRRGVRLNNDAVDNSGGVDLSDHEVNLKLLFRERERSGELDRTRRNRLLENLSESVVERVLEDNTRQSAVISLERLDDEHRLEDFRELMEHLETSANLDRALESLPDEREMRERARAGEGMARPELALLLSYVKQDLQHRTKQLEWPDETVLEGCFRRYFPEEIHREFEGRIGDHPLRRDIALTVLVNGAVDDAGIPYFHRLQRETGAGLRELLLWYLAADRLGGATVLREALFSREDDLAAEQRYRLWRWIQDQLADAVAWLVDVAPRLEDAPTLAERGEDRLDEHAPGLLERMDPERRERWEQQQRRWEQAGFEDPVPRSAARLMHLVPLLNVLHVQSRTEGELTAVADRYFEVGRTLHLHWLTDRLRQRPAPDRWDQFASRSMASELHRLQADLTETLLDEKTEVRAFRREHEDTVRRLAEVREELSREEHPPLSALQFMLQRLRGLT